MSIAPGLEVFLIGWLLGAKVKKYWMKFLYIE